MWVKGAPGRVSYTVMLHKVYGPVFLFQIFYNFTDVLVALRLLLLGLMNAFIPWINNYAFFVGVMFVCGISLGIINTGTLRSFNDTVKVKTTPEFGSVCPQNFIITTVW